ncbi:MAG: hypothetical protein A2031_07950 [Deltaproteobacteria bacterium RBG_19FT_COMBO_43_11]|nr:MAG: hypothetical protein A2W27_08125 [Deltaproteobacteria bacterium RBG_16_44_11]OGP87128.1 MAG: hypothetical protein A2031_07950 [Deltaproteobacteria bacterium RBG_19FT_COMBO_43_11]
MKKFYDIHFHALTLGHPNLLAFIQRMNWRLLLMTTPISAPIMGFLGKDKVVKNLLGMMENDLGNYFLILEYYLRQSSCIQGDVVTVSGNKYKKIVLTPLIMDFGFKNIMSDTFYKLPAQKPIVEQMTDLYEAITCYNMFDLEVVPRQGNAVNCEHVLVEKESKLFEIYPFISLNTSNYTLATIEKIMAECFGNYKPDISVLYGNMGTVKGFAGVKLYPPLGFDPWPQDIKEQEKVRFLYQYCCNKKIPVTTHCSDGGFAIVNEANVYTTPDKWESVLQEYPTLKLNLAHMGAQNKKNWLVFSQSDWQTKVLRLVNSYENVYTDFSCLAFADSYYKDLIALVNKQKLPHYTKQRILFGTDFMINLLWSPSYNQYLETFCNTKRLCDNEKDLFCSVNPERFLFN